MFHPKFLSSSYPIDSDQRFIQTFKDNVDAFFLLVMGLIVFLMQCGFAFLEAGSVRSKNTVLGCLNYPFWFISTKKSIPMLTYCTTVFCRNLKHNTIHNS